MGGRVDERVEGLVDRREEAGGGVVGVLELQHQGHLLVEVDPGGRLASGVYVPDDGRLDLDPAIDGLAFDAEAHDQPVVRVRSPGELGDLLGHGTVPGGTR